MLNFNKTSTVENLSYLTDDIIIEYYAHSAQTASAAQLQSTSCLCHLLARKQCFTEQGGQGVFVVSISTFGMQISNKHARDPRGMDNDSVSHIVRASVSPQFIKQYLFYLFTCYYYQLYCNLLFMLQQLRQEKLRNQSKPKLNPLTPVPPVTARDEPWPFFRF